MMGSKKLSEIKAELSGESKRKPIKTLKSGDQHDSALERTLTKKLQALERKIKKSAKPKKRRPVIG